MKSDASADNFGRSGQTLTENLGPYLTLVSELFNSIECGACNAVIYRPQGKFDREVLNANRSRHYAESPDCKPSALG